MRFLFAFVWFFCSALPWVSATHIVGGVVYYECQGRDVQNNTTTYLITMKIYRDAIGGQAPFDNPASLGIFQGNSTFPFQTVSMLRPSIRNIPLVLTNPCLVVPPNIAVEEGVYTAVVTLPYHAAGYHFSYQRCCRNNTINNLINPGNVGATYTTFVSGAAQLACNSSPQFTDFPPIAICQNKPLVFDHSATDRDGNRLEYELCHSFTGGTTTNPAPVPPSAPPYGLVPFSAGYTSANPLNATPNLSIDRNTGLLTGTPTRLGQFVVGICVREFDSRGNLLGVTLRDFQFNVAFCEDQVNAQIRADSVSPDGQRFVLNSCGNRNISFENQSTILRFITAYEWRFFNAAGNTVFNSSDFNVSVLFPSFGTYTGWLIANPGQVGCTDTAFITVNVFPPLTANFNFSIDSCNPNRPPIAFQDISSGGGTNQVVNWSWDFGNNQTANIRNPQHLFPAPGTYNVGLIVQDNNGCRANTSRALSWFPPATPNAAVNNPSGCVPHAVNFSNTANPIGNGYTFRWDFGDGSPPQNQGASSHSYTRSGVFQARFQVRSPWGCLSEDTLQIEVFAPPQVGFTATDTACALQSVQFDDASSSPSGNALAAWSWAFGDGNTAQGRNVSHLYNNPGTYNVRLSVTDARGCQGQAQRSISWFPAPNLAIDTQFTGCLFDTLFIQNNSFPQNGYTFQWNFGDGQSSTQVAPRHIYSSRGSYTLTVTGTSPSGCNASLSRTIRVNGLPIPRFAYTYDPCVFDTIRFQDNSQVGPENSPLQAWSWTFNDGGQSNLRNPGYLYMLAGNYPVQLRVTDANGCSASTTDTIAWFPAPVIDVRLAADTGCTPFIAFFDNQSYPINGYTTVWNFGDGNTSNQASPVHTYTRQGIYPVTLLITSPRGCQANYTNTVVVRERPRAGFSFSFDSCAFNGVQIQDQSQTNTDGIPLNQWFWNFGDGGQATNILDTLYPFAPRANYAVQLIIEDNNTCRDTVVRNIPYFPSPVFPPPLNSLAGCRPLSVAFQNNPLNNFPGYRFQRQFGDGRSSNSFDTSLIYTQAGRYIALLRIDTDAGCTETFRDTIVVYDLPIARMGIDYDSCSGGPVRFRNTSLPSNQGLIQQALWQFGDGNTANQNIVFHQYADTNTYTIALLVIDEHGCRDSIQRVLDWRPRPVFPLSLANSRACLPLVVADPPDNPYPIAGYELTWRFGEGTTSNQASGAFTYNQPGVYTRRLVVRSPSGCIDSFSSRHEALAVPVAAFGFQPNPITSLEPLVQFNDASIGAENWLWDFGLNRNQGGSNLQNPEHLYRDTGLFRVRLVVQHLSGCRDTAERSLEIIPQFTYFLPNAFTPNGDGTNDVYMGRGILDFTESFQMAIYNRWGERVFETQNPNEAWNGRKFNSLEACPAGVYVVVVRIKGPRGEEREIKGFATIVY